eukprot:gene13124-biopygen1970
MFSPEKVVVPLLTGVPKVAKITTISPGAGHICGARPARVPRHRDPLRAAAPRPRAPPRRAGPPRERRHRGRKQGAHHVRQTLVRRNGCVQSRSPLLCPPRTQQKEGRDTGVVMGARGAHGVSLHTGSTGAP